MNLVTTNLKFPTETNSWDAARYWAGMSARFKQADLTCQVMAGFVLKELRDNFSASGARSDLTSPNDSARFGWQEKVKKETGISDDTARNWIKMATGIRSKWKKLGVLERVQQLMSVPPSQWKKDEAKLIQSAVHKVTDGKTQLDFMWELGVAKKPPGNKSPTPGKARKLSTAEEAAKLREMAMEDSGAMGMAIQASNKNFFLLDNEMEINAQVEVLKSGYELRLKWLNTPKAKRDPQIVIEALKQQ